MSIPNLLNKIKGYIDLDKDTVLYLLLIIVVSLASFGLGRLSVMSRPNDENNVIIKGDKDYASSDTFTGGENREPDSSILASDSSMSYVASKNGKLYYRPSCPTVKRIKEENRVWFTTASEAEKAGYKLSTSCK